MYANLQDFPYARSLSPHGTFSSTQQVRYVLIAEHSGR